jgi:hypothetical protein
MSPTPHVASDAVGTILRGANHATARDCRAVGPPLEWDMAASILDELRTQYEASRTGTAVASDVEGFEALNTRMRHAYAWLDKAFSYLDGLKPPIAHRFDLGHGVAFQKPRFRRGYVGQHERRIVGFPVLDEINMYYEIEAEPLVLQVDPLESPAVGKALDDAGLHFAWRSVEDAGGKVRKCVVSVDPFIPAKIAFIVDYQTGMVTVPMVNVDRIDRVTLEFHSRDIDDTVLDDLLRFILGRDAAFLRRAPLAGVHRPGTR